MLCHANGNRARNHDPHNSIDVQKPRSCFVMQMATEPEKCQVCRFQGRKTVKCLLLLRKGFPPTDRKEDLPLTVEFMNSLATSQAICLWTILERRRKRKKKEELERRLKKTTYIKIKTIHCVFRIFFSNTFRLPSFEAVRRNWLSSAFPSVLFSAPTHNEMFTHRALVRLCMWLPSSLFVMIMMMWWWWLWWCGGGDYDDGVHKNSAGTINYEDGGVHTHAHATTHTRAHTQAPVSYTHLTLPTMAVV